MATSITVTVDTVNYVFTRDSADKDSVRYLEPTNTLSLPKVLLTRRVYPKKQKDFPGVARNSLKTTRTFSYADGTTCPIIMETSVSRRADTLDGDLQFTRKLHGQLILDGELDAFFSSLSL